MRASAMVEWHAREVLLMNQPRGPALPTLPLAPREKGLQELAAEAVGKAFGALHSTDEISYRDAKHLLAHDTATVMALLRACGPGAFEEPEPAADFGLGVVDGTVREALVDEGYLLEEA